jgi:ABC-type transport system involved in cytochrome bd biosynthesis fused ATPase/permease subunit
MMIPSSSDQSPDTRPALVALVLALMITVSILLALISAWGAGSALLPVILLVLLVAIVPLVFMFVRGQPAGKRKRSGQDTYKMIDHMVDDLDDEELEYVRGRLEDRQTKQKADLSEDMVDLINLRDLDRRAGKRD